MSPLLDSAPSILQRMTVDPPFDVSPNRRDSAIATISAERPACKPLSPGLPKLPGSFGPATHGLRTSTKNNLSLVERFKKSEWNLKSLKFERLEGAVLGGDQQLAMKRAFGGAAIEGLFRGKTREIRIVIFLREMREDKVARPRIKTLRVGKVLAYGVIREMAGAGEDSLLDDPRVRANLEHIQIVIRFEK